MHDRQFDEAEEIPLAQLEALNQWLREQAEAPIIIGGVSYYVFRPPPIDQVDGN